MKQLFNLSAGVAAVLVNAFSPAARAQESYTVHEWGTFTSVQGGTGRLLSWYPLQSSELPGFVYDWKKPGLERKFTGFAGNGPYQGKVSFNTLQRLETPVIYFYSGQEMNVGVSVDFPKGLITEWYPQTSQMGPSLSLATNQASNSSTKQSRAVWNNLRLTPQGLPQKKGRNLAQDNAGSHYYTARDTDSDFVQTAPGQSNSSETEKFLFYRGVGNFATPLRVTMTANGMVFVENTGTDKLARLFFVSIHDGCGAFDSMGDLPSQERRQWMGLTGSGENTLAARRVPLADFQKQIAARMESALTNAGLFPREAAAMVNTWKDSWFAEEGERVLYLLPRAWTDETLPITFSPPPQNLVRVMVGRAEIITPKAQHELADALTRAATGDAAAHDQAIRQLERFGRFAEPALQLANVRTQADQSQIYGTGLLAGVAGAHSETR